MSENYTIEIWRAANLGYPPELLRTHSSATVDGAETLVDSLRDSYGDRESVVWAGDEVDDKGFLAGQSPMGFYTIVVKPPLKVTQS